MMPRPLRARIARSVPVALAVALLLAATTARADDPVTLKSAWMRPAPAGKVPARVYVDIESTVDGKLVSAQSPIAKRIDLVRVKTLGDPASEVVVRSFPIAAGKTTRLAYYGDHLRFSGLTRDAGNGDPVPLTLTFVDAAGRRFTATTDVLVRGLLLPQQMPPSAPPAGAPDAKGRRAPMDPGRPSYPPADPMESQAPARM